MFLLIPTREEYKLSVGKDFTFHYVSINTRDVCFRKSRERSLHSTMFLLIHIIGGVETGGQTYFTFHYASINTLSSGSSMDNDFLYIPLCFY